MLLLSAACQFVLQGVPRCVLQLVAVGCVFIATKQLEVRHRLIMCRFVFDA
jgi:hypothetical protein